MRISAVEKYGLRCLLVLARVGPDKQLSISEIADMEKLSVPYVSKLLSILRKADLVIAARGRSGGFSIARPPAEIDMYEVITALDGPIINPDHCSNNAGADDQCVHMDNCSVHDILGGLSGLVRHFLSRTTLEDLIANEQSGGSQLSRSSMITSESLVNSSPDKRKTTQQKKSADPESIGQR